jgi:hypothetical protein
VTQHGVRVAWWAVLGELRHSGAHNRERGAQAGVGRQAGPGSRPHTGPPGGPRVKQERVLAHNQNRGKKMRANIQNIFLLQTHLNLIQI